MQETCGRVVRYRILYEIWVTTGLSIRRDFEDFPDPDVIFER
jgi:hypothetical protein